MSGAKHTPGPWRVYPPGTSVPGYDVCDRIVADGWTGRSASDGPSDADAQAIAAVPDLIAALQRATALLEVFAKRAEADGIAGGGDTGEAYRQAEAALKKAGVR